MEDEEEDKRDFSIAKAGGGEVFLDVDMLVLCLLFCKDGASCGLCNGERLRGFWFFVSLCVVSSFFPFYCW